MNYSVWSRAKQYLLGLQSVGGARGGELDEYVQNGADSSPRNRVWLPAAIQKENKPTACYWSVGLM